MPPFPPVPPLPPWLTDVTPLFPSPKVLIEPPAKFATASPPKPPSPPCPPPAKVEPPPVPPAPPTDCARIPPWFTLSAWPAKVTVAFPPSTPLPPVPPSVKTLCPPVPPCDPTEMPTTATGGLTLPALEPPTVTGPLVGAATVTATVGPEFPVGPPPGCVVWFEKKG